MTDVYRELVKQLSTAGQVVYVEVPHNAPLDKLPCIDLQPAGPGSNLGAFNALGGDLVDVDVDFYAPVDYFNSGMAYEHASAIRSFLSKIRLPGFNVVAVTYPISLPDRNPRIRRLGMTATVAVTHT